MNERRYKVKETYRVCVATSLKKPKSLIGNCGPNLKQTSPIAKCTFEAKTLFSLSIMKTWKPKLYQIQCCTKYGTTVGTGAV